MVLFLQHYLQKELYSNLKNKTFPPPQLSILDHCGKSTAVRILGKSCTIELYLSAWFLTQSRHVVQALLELISLLHAGINVTHCTQKYFYFRDQGIRTHKSYHIRSTIQCQSATRQGTKCTLSRKS